VSEIEIHNLCKSYGKTLALDNLSMSVEKNGFYGLIGPDGAGKSTLMRIITSLLLPDSGSLSVAGLDPVKDYRKLRLKLGYMPGRFSLYKDLTVEENLNFFATVFGTSIKENYHLIKSIYSQIEPFKDRRAGKLSGGMKQKLALCCALIHKPKVLLLDEPTTGVDPVSRKEFWEMLKRLKKENITILVSTPYMDEAAMCDRIALIQKGRFLKIETPEEIKNQFGHKLYTVKSEEMFRLLNDLRNNDIIRTCYAFGDSHHITLKNEEYFIDNLYETLKNKGHKSLEIIETAAGIEDCFMELTTNDETR
jgi:ABC-2 type transport system ATP-binding protein